MQLMNNLYQALGRTDTITEKWHMFVEENVDDWANTNLVVRTILSIPPIHHSLHHYFPVHPNPFPTPPLNLSAFQTSPNVAY